MSGNFRDLEFKYFLRFQQKRGNDPYDTTQKDQQNLHLFGQKKVWERERKNVKVFLWHFCWPFVGETIWMDHLTTFEESCSKHLNGNSINFGRISIWSNLYDFISKQRKLSKCIFLSSHCIYEFGKHLNCFTIKYRGARNIIPGQFSGNDDLASIHKHLLDLY